VNDGHLERDARFSLSNAFITGATGFVGRALAARLDAPF